MANYCTFKKFLGLESMSLEFFVECTTTSSDEEINVGLAPIFMAFLQFLMAFLQFILSEMSYMSLLSDLVIESNKDI